MSRAAVPPPSGDPGGARSHAVRRAAAELPWVWKRSLKTLWRTRSLSTTLFVHGMNKAWVGLAKGLKIRDQERFAHLTRENPRMDLIKRSFTFRCGSYKAATVPETG